MLDEALTSDREMKMPDAVKLTVLRRKAENVLELLEKLAKLEGFAWDDFPKGAAAT